VADTTLKGNALIIDKVRTQFMQYADVFDKAKVVVQSIELNYTIKDCDPALIPNKEAVLLEAALQEFGKDGIALLFGRNIPLYINPNVQCVSDGKRWGRLIDMCEQYYSDVEFEHDNRFMNISIKSQDNATRNND
jgi:hypothetical protein